MRFRKGQRPLTSRRSQTCTSVRYGIVDAALARPARGRARAPAHARLREARDEADRADARRRPSASSACSLREHVLSSGPKRRRPVERGAPSHRRGDASATRRGTGSKMRLERLVNGVPSSTRRFHTSASRPPGPQDAVDLREGRRRRRTSGTPGRRSRGRPPNPRAGSASAVPPSARTEVRQHRAHLGHGLHRDHVAPLAARERVSFPVPAARSRRRGRATARAARAPPLDSRAGRARRRPRTARSRARPLVHRGHASGSSASSENMTRSSRTPWRRR